MRTYQDINEKIRKGEAVILTAEEAIELVASKGLKAAAKEVDVVTTATFGPMCSSGAFLNFGHSKPKIKMQKCWLNDVEAYGGLAAVDVYLGATQIPDNDPANSTYPGKFEYGGGHVIQDLIEGKDVLLKATSYGTDCYPRKDIETWVNIDEINEAILTNPRNGYQNYNVATNSSTKSIYTYLGKLKKNFGNATYCSAGQLSPLLKDPHYKTIGIGTRIWLGGTQGYVYWNGTQHAPITERNELGIPKGGAGTIAVVGDLKKMSSEFIRGTSMTGYGVTLSVGIGVPIPILNEDIFRNAVATDADITAPIIDYATSYPNRDPGVLGEVSYAELKSGTITINGKDVPTASLSSYSKAVRIANLLKDDIKKGDFLLSEPAQLLPEHDANKFKPLNIRG
ncbi:MAG: homocysteine biosynthesis protein, partial [Nanoarchaeota archaeon]|nr:homocysteine biosynthesis protein [Nanoarchaeota archaeon]